jgi:hypothetical protein
MIQDSNTLRLFREATTAPCHVKRGDDNDNIILKPEQGTSRAYTLDRLSRERPDLYQRVNEP